MIKSLKIASIIRLKDLLFFFVAVSLFEVFIGGGGRFFEIGPLTLRMYVFVFLLVFGTFYILIKRKIDKTVLGIFSLYAFTIALSATFGIINNAEISYIFEDIKPLLYFMSILYLYHVVSIDNIPKIIKIIKISGLFLSVVYFFLLLMLLFNYINFAKFYVFISTSKEVMFRGTEGLFFYKGFLYLNIAFLFYFLGKSNRSVFFITLLGLAILLTLTRGFILSLGICLFIYFVFLNRNIYKKLIFLLVSLICVILYMVYIVPQLGDKSLSDTIRYTQIQQVINATTPLSFFLGHGFGIGVPIRPIHMEISYLEIFHKQGILGLAFWSVLFGFILFYYVKIRSTFSHYEVDAFFIGTLFVYIQTFTNPFLNNPIGMTFVILTLLIFKTLYQHKKNDLSMYTHI